MVASWGAGEEVPRPSARRGRRDVLVACGTRRVLRQGPLMLRG